MMLSQIKFLCSFCVSVFLVSKLVPLSILGYSEIAIGKFWVDPIGPDQDDTVSISKLCSPLHFSPVLSFLPLSYRPPLWHPTNQHRLHQWLSSTFTGGETDDKSESLFVGVRPLTPWTGIAGRFFIKLQQLMSCQQLCGAFPHRLRGGFFKSSSFAAPKNRIPKELVPVLRDTQVGIFYAASWGTTSGRSFRRCARSSWTSWGESARVSAPSVIQGMVWSYVFLFFFEISTICITFVNTYFFTTCHILFLITSCNNQLMFNWAMLQGIPWLRTYFLIVKYLCPALDVLAPLHRDTQSLPTRFEHSHR